MGVVFLISAIVMEVFGSSMLKLSAIHTSKWPISGIIIGYAVSFYFFSLALVSIPLSVGYAVWSGVGTALTVLVGFLLFKEKISGQTISGISLVILGIILLRL